jgi:hypothetical protein
MADEDEDEPAVELGEGEQVEGAPLARISARLMWGIEKSAILEREGETTIRTPDGPRELGEILESVDSTYFATRQEFENAVQDVIGTGSVPTVGDGTDEDVPEDSQPVESSDDGSESPAEDDAGGESANGEPEDSGPAE